MLTGNSDGRSSLHVFVINQRALVFSRVSPLYTGQSVHVRVGYLDLGTLQAEDFLLCSTFKDRAKQRN